MNANEKSGKPSRVPLSELGDLATKVAKMREHDSVRGELTPRRVVSRPVDIEIAAFGSSI